MFKKIKPHFGILYIVFLFIQSCNLSSTPRARIIEPQGLISVAEFDLLEVWCPHGMYCIDWRVGISSDPDSTYMIGKGSQKGIALSGSFQLMNNFLDNNELNIDSLNEVMSEIPPDKPILVHRHRIDNASETIIAHFIVFTNTPDIYQEKKTLFDIAYKYIFSV